MLNRLNNLNLKKANFKLDSPATHLLWWNASSELIFFLLYQFVNFTSFVDGLYEEVMKKDLKGGRDQLMWALLQVAFQFT